MSPNTNEYMSKYMLEYVKNSPKIKCDICGGSYKKVYYYRHIKSNNHNNIKKFIESFQNDTVLDGRDFI